MLLPRSLRLTIDPGGHIVCQTRSTPPVDALAHAIREAERRAGESRHTLLSNLVPVHVEAIQGTLQAARMSGLPHLSRAARAPIRHNANAQTLFLARGDCYMLRVHANEVSAVTFVSLDYGIAPTLTTTDAPLTLRNPLDSILAELNGARLLAVALERELAPIEQHIAATTMPTVWRQLGGPPVAVITAPTAEDIETCHRFCALFNDPRGRLELLATQSPQWSVALGDNIHRHDQGQDYSRGVSGVASRPFAAIPIIKRNDRQAKQPPRPGNPAMVEAFDVRGSRAVGDVTPSRPVNGAPAEAPPVRAVPAKAELASAGERHAGVSHTPQAESPATVTPHAAAEASQAVRAVKGVRVSRAVEESGVDVADTSQQEKLTDTEDETQARPTPRMRF